MSDPSPAVPDHRAGLCSACTHHRVVENRRGSRFYLCERSKDDPRFARYPRLPVLRCPGFQRDGTDRTEDPTTERKIP